MRVLRQFLNEFVDILYHMIADKDRLRSGRLIKSQKMSPEDILKGHSDELLEKRGMITALLINPGKQVMG